MTSYTDVFNSDPIPPSVYAFQSWNLSANQSLAWPEIDGTDAVAAVNEVTTTAGLVVTMPDATDVSVGRDVLFRNVGSNTFTVNGNSGSQITTVAAGEAKYVYLKDNATAGGAWGVFTYGTGTSSADASALAGAGLEANGAVLRQDVVARAISGTGSVTTADRARILVCTGGSYTLSLPSAASAEDGFFFALSNTGSGNVTLDGDASETVDGETTKIVPAGGSLALYCNGSAWYSVGFGRDIIFAFSETTITDTSGTVTLSASQVSGRMIRLGNPLTGDLTIALPAVTGIYFVKGNTWAGGYTATFQIDDPALGTAVGISTDESVSLYSDATNISPSNTYGSALPPQAGNAGKFLQTDGAAATWQTALKPSDIGVSVQAYDATILKSASIGVTVQGYDATTLKSADIGASIQAYTQNASQAEMEAGTEAANRMMSPLRVRQAIAGGPGFKVTRSARSSNTILAEADRSTLIEITSGTFTQTFTAAATLTSGWWCYYYNSGDGDVTLDPNSSEQIDGLTSYIMYPGEARLIVCTGTAFETVVLSGFNRTFTASGTFTTPPGYKEFAGLLWGGGSGGGSSDTYGGGGGACVPLRYLASAMSATETVTIGAAAAANASGNNSTFKGVTARGGSAVDGGSWQSQRSSAAIISYYSPTTEYAFLYNLDGFGGIGGRTGTDIGQPATGGYSSYSGNSDWGGAAGGIPGPSSSASSGGNSVYGGAGGGYSGAGTSVFGGNGGAASFGGTGGNGTAPGGGGGAGATGGQGARGELRIWGVI